MLKLMRLATRSLTRACALASIALVGACGARSRHGMDIPPKELTYSDDCKLQAYFDERAAAGLSAPQAADEMLATNDKGRTIGEGTYVLKDPQARRRFGRLLRDEYDGVDKKMVHSVESSEGRVTVHVRWWDAGPIRRLRPSDDVVLVTSAGELELPPNPCVSDFLFGDKVYAMRARFLKNEVDLETGKYESADAGLPPEPSTTPSPVPTPTPSPSMAPSAVAAPLP